MPEKIRSYTEPESFDEIKSEMKKKYRNPWKTNGVVHHSFHLDRLPISDLDNWEVLRVNMAERSYKHPKSNILFIS